MLSVSEVLNAGVGGNNTRMLLERLDADVLAQHPDLVLLMVGTNDALNTSCLLPIDEYRTNLHTLCSRIRDVASLLLMTILPCDVPSLLLRHAAHEYGDVPPEERITQVNQAIRSYAAVQQIPLVDTHSIFTAIGYVGDGENSLIRNAANCGIADGVHPTADGYRVIATTVFQAILDHQLPTQRIVCFGDSITYGAHMQGEGTADGETYPGFLRQMLIQHQSVNR